MKNIFANFIPHETIVCDDRNPHWIISKGFDPENNTAYKYYQKSKKIIQVFQVVQQFQNFSTATIEVSKQQYHG